MAAPVAAPVAATALTAAQLGELAREIRGERARLQRSMLAARARRDAAPAAAGDGPASARADEGLARELDSRMLARHEELTEALRRLEDGSYGVCARCGKPIPFGRLLMMPEATRCVAC